MQESCRWILKLNRVITYFLKTEYIQITKYRNINDRASSFLSFSGLFVMLRIAFVYVILFVHVFLKTHVFFPEIQVYVNTFLSKIPF